MNKRTIRMVTDMVIAILLAVGLSFLTDLILPNLFIEELAIFLLPLVWCVCVCLNSSQPNCLQSCMALWF